MWLPQLSRLNAVGVGVGGLGDGVGVGVKAEQVEQTDAASIRIRTNMKALRRIWINSFREISRRKAWIHEERIFRRRCRP